MPSCASINHFVTLGDSHSINAHDEFLPDSTTSEKTALSKKGSVTSKHHKLMQLHLICHRPLLSI